MANDWGTAAISAIPIMGDIVNGISQSNQNKKNRKWQSHENQLARDYNSQMWEKNNAYNDPAQQMARLKNAGINPHLAYSNGSPMNTSNAPASSNASSMPAGIAPQMNVGNIMQSMLLKAQIDNIKADTDQKRTTTTGQTILNGINQINLENQAEKVSLDLGLSRMNIQVGEKRIQVDDQQIKESIQKVTNLISQDKVLEQQFQNLITEKKYTEAQTSQVLALVGVAYANARNLEAQTRLTNEKSASERSWRSNVEADTLNKNEMFKSLNRGNTVGEKFDFSLMENRFNLGTAQINQVKQQVLNLATDGQLKSLQLDHGKFNYLLDQVLMPANVANGYKNALNPLSNGSTTSTYRYDKKGNFQGSTVQKRKNK